MDATRHELVPPPLHEIGVLLADALRRCYVESSASVVDCPNLRRAPFYLAAEGLCSQSAGSTSTGNAGTAGLPTIADIGGQANLFPVPRRDKNYSLLETARLMKLDPARGSLLGAGAGPHRVHGTNSELAANLSWTGALDEDHVVDLSYTIQSSSSSTTREKVTCSRSHSTECALMANVYGSQGLRGPVLCVRARGRRPGQEGPPGRTSFPQVLRRALQDAYPSRQVSLGGVFVLRRGRARFHVMPDFPPADELPFADRDALERWLTFHSFDGPMVCLSVLHSADPQKLGIRMEHTHCFTVDGSGRGGHYHYELDGDGDEDEVEFEGYFNVAHAFVQVDRAPAYWEKEESKRETRNKETNKRRA